MPFSHMQWLSSQVRPSIKHGRLIDLLELYLIDRKPFTDCTTF